MKILQDAEQKLFHSREIEQRFESAAFSFTFSPNSVDVIICYNESHHIRVINTISHDEASEYRIEFPKRATYSPDGKHILIGSEYGTSVLCASTKNVTSYDIGFYKPGLLPNVHFESFTFSPNGKIALFCVGHAIYQIDIISGTVTKLSGLITLSGISDGMREIASFYYPVCLVFTPNGNFVFICDRNNHAIRCISLHSGQVFTIAGIAAETGSFRNGKAKLAGFKCPCYAIYHQEWECLLVCDSGNHCIRKICLKTKIVSTFAGIPEQSGCRHGPKEQALFEKPTHITLSPDKSLLIICDKNCIRSIKLNKKCF